MRILISLLSFIILLGCSGESSSQDKITEKKAANKESSVLGLFGKKEDKNYVISSPLEGILVKGGEPLANTKIIRRLRWNGNEEGIVDEFITDDTGYFSLPAYEKTLSLNTMTQFVGSVTIFAHTETDDNFIWYSPKTDGDMHSDTGGELGGMICDLDNEEERVDATSHGILTRCRWKNMPVE